MTDAAVNLARLMGTIVAGSGLAVVVMKPDASDAWMFSGVILSLLFTICSTDTVRRGKVGAKLCGTLAMGLALPHVIYELCHTLETVQTLSHIGPVWLAAGFLSGVTGYSLMRAAVNWIHRNIIERVDHSGAHRPDMIPKTQFPPDETTRTGDNGDNGSGTPG